MGSSNSTSIKNYVTNSVEINQTVASSINVAANTYTANYQLNKNTINVGVPSKCCQDGTELEKVACIGLFKGGGAGTMDCGVDGIDISQSGKMDIKITKKVTAESNSELINSVAQQMQATIAGLVKQNNDSGVLSGVFGQKNDTEITNQISNSLKSDLTVKMTTNVQSSIRSASGQENENELNVCLGQLKAGSCTINQDFSFNLYIVNVVGAIGNISSQNTDVQKLATNVKDTTEQTNTNFLSDFASGLGKMGQAVIIAVIGFVAVAAIFALVFFLRTFKGKKGQHTDVDYSRGKGHLSYASEQTKNYNAKGMDPHGDGLSGLPSKNTTSVGGRRGGTYGYVQAKAGAKAKSALESMPASMPKSMPASVSQAMSLAMPKLKSM